MLSLQQVKAVDRRRMLDRYLKWPVVSERSLSQPLVLPERRKFTDVLLAGMGGSGSAVRVLADWQAPTSRLPLTVLQDYDLPGWVSEKTLAVIVSFSGQTEEMVSVLKAAKKRGSSVVSVTTGGPLMETSRKEGVPCNKVESLLVPRASMPSMLFVSSRILAEMGVVEPVESELAEAVSVMKKTLAESGPAVPHVRNPAKRLAVSLKGRSIAVYAPSELSSVALRFAALMNENAGVAVQVETYPELFHNEAESWGGSRDRTVVTLRRRKEAPRVRKNLNNLRDVIEAAGGRVETLWSGGGRLAWLTRCCLFLDLVSIYLAVLRHKDPLATPLISRVKAN